MLQDKRKSRVAERKSGILDRWQNQKESSRLERRAWQDWRERRSPSAVMFVAGAVQSRQVSKVGNNLM